MYGFVAVNSLMTSIHFFFFPLPTFDVLVRHAIGKRYRKKAQWQHSHNIYPDKVVCTLQGADSPPQRIPVKSNEAALQISLW